MAAASGRFGATECVLRGGRSVAANWQLVAAVFLQSVLTGALIVAGLMAPLAGLGISLLDGLSSGFEDWPRAGERLVDGLAAASLSPLLPGLAAMLAAWLVAFLVYCYFQAGVAGVLALAERQAGAAPASWRAFRVFSMAAFHRQARQLFWRCFWLNHLLAAAFLLWSLLALLLAALVAQTVSLGRAGTAVAAGCLGALPLGLLLLVALWWSVLAAADVGRPSSGAWIAVRRAWRTLLRRPGAVMLIWLLAVVGWLMVSSAMMPLSWILGYAAGDLWSVWLAARGLLLLAELLIDSVLIVALLAASLSLVRGCMAPEAAG